MIAAFWCLLTAGSLGLVAIACHGRRAEKPLVYVAWGLIVVSYLFVIAEWRQI